MWPYFIVFGLGIMFLTGYHQKCYNLAERGVKKVKRKLKFYRVMLPIIWSKDSVRANTALIMYVTFHWIGMIISKVNLFLAKEITNTFTEQSDTSVLVVPWTLLIFSSLLKMVHDFVNVTKSKQQSSLQKDLENRMQTEAFSKVHAMSVRWNIEKGLGEVRMLVKVGGCVWWDILYKWDTLIPLCVSVVFSFIYISTRYSVWTAIILVFMSTVLNVPRHFFTKWSSQLRSKEVKAEQEALSRSMESLSNFQTVKNFACEDDERERYKKLKDAMTDAGYEKRWWKDLFDWCMDSLTTTLSLGITLYGATLLSKGQISYGEYVLLTSLFLELYNSVYKLYSEAMGAIPALAEQLDMTVGLLNETPEVTDKENATDIQINNGRIEFKNVTFSYGSYAMKKDSTDSTADALPVKPALVDISFIVEPGQSLALVGGSGSGKSTIARLLTRMYDIDEGEILIDHQDISEVTMKSLRSSIGIVPQEVDLFNETITDNIRYGSPHATEEEVIEAATKAEIHEKILELEDKYETKVGNKGMKLSGGQRQRIGISRVFIKESKIVILDEATSALDTITEKKIQASLEMANKGKTSVVIAHRLSTICKADQIIVLDHGKIVEKGSHQELLELGGMYAAMWNQQTEKEVKAEEAEEDVIEDKSFLLKRIRELHEKVARYKKDYNQREPPQSSSWGDWASSPPVPSLSWSMSLS